MLVELKLKEVISKEPTLLVLVVGVPNVGKSAIINSIHRIATSRFPGDTCLRLFLVSIFDSLVALMFIVVISLVQEKVKHATVGPLPGVTKDIAGYKVLMLPIIYSLV